MPISRKQKQILAFPFTSYDALIADGAIRSGKTAFMTIAFIDDAMRRFDGQRFGICGKTVDSTVKNVIIPYLSLSFAKQKYIMQWKRTEKILVISNGVRKNIFEIFGGKDESSFALIQGRTLAGVLFDEAALLPRSFVEQALARCSVSGSRFWFNCNPESPMHWFYTEWICKAREKNALHIHFELEDNPALDRKIIERYKSLYTGVFYKRYIQGLWVAADGLVYDVDMSLVVTDKTPTVGRYYVSVDYGTLNPCSMGLWCVNGKTATRIREYYYSGRETARQKTDEEYYAELTQLCGDLAIECVVVDPSAASFIATIRKRGKFSVRRADNDVINGIRTTSLMLKNGTISIHSSCTHCLRELGTYRWDEKSATDKVIKDNDHCMDDMRYFCQTIMRRRLRSVYYDEN